MRTLLFFGLSLGVIASLNACSSSDSSADGDAGPNGGNGGGKDSGGGTITLPDGATVVVDSSVPVHNDGELVTYGETYSGGEFHLGPVDYDETQWHNACAPLTKYASSIRQMEGNFLAGLWNGIPNVADYCDSCIYVTTAKGKKAMLRVVTFGDTSQNSIDVSPEAFAVLDSGEYPRTMSFQFAKCPDTGKIVYEFQTGSSEYWTSFWLRNARVPIKKVEVQSANHGSYIGLERGTDGTLTDASGFGKGDFKIKITGIDGSELIDSISWPSGGIAGQTITGQGNFP